jgi:predicted transposase/invertase (TIGR01784 family)
VLTLSIHTSGGDVSYKIPALKVKKYSIEEIFQKKLLFLIPFYIFTFEDDFDKIEENEDKMQRLKENYADITRRLEALSLAGDIDGYTKQTICEMSERVLKGIAHQYEKIQKEVTKIMGGEILEYPAKTFLRQGIEQGIEQGRLECQADMIGKLLSKGYTCAEIADMLDMDKNEIEKIQAKMLQTV